MNHEGYTCPHYLLSRPSFSSACDVFSWGVVVCELITGNISCNESQHYLMYKMNKTSSLEDDADACVDWGCGRSLRKMAELALKCMRFAPDRRPSIGRIVKEVQMIINDERQVNRSIDIEVSPRSKSRQRCCFCGEVSKKFVNCCGSKKHTHCQNCLQSGLERNINRCRYGGLRCLKDGCDSKRFEDEVVAPLVSPDIWDAYTSQRSSNLLQMMGKTLMSHTEERFQQMQDLLMQVTTNGLLVPKLFILVEANSGNHWHPKEWAKNAASVKLYLYFVCSHSLQPVSDKCRIKIRYRRDWMKAIAPALNLSLDLIQLTMNIFTGRELHLDFVKIKEMDEWAKELLTPSERDRMEEVSRMSPSKSRNDMSSELQVLVGDSLSRVAEKAAAQNIKWQSELVPVYDYEKKEPTFVMKKYAQDSRYQRENDIFYTP